MLHQNFSELQINDILFTLSFDLGEIGILWRYLISLPLAGGPREGKRLMTVEGLFLPPADHTKSDNCERNTQKWNSNNKDDVRKKPLRHGCD